MRVLTYKEIDREEWNALVKASATGTWFQTPEAYEFFASMPKLFKPFVVGVICDPAGAQTKLRGVCVGYVTVEKSAVKQWLTRRAIIIGGPCFADDCANEEVSLLLSTLRQQLSTGANAPIYIESRNFNDYSRWKDAFASAGFDYKAHLNFHVDCRDKEAMWERMSENRRRQVRKAQATVECLTNEGISELDVREWYEILRMLYRTKVKTPLWPVEFFLEAYRQGVGKFLLVKHEGKVIGGSMVVVWKPTSDKVLRTAIGSPIEQSSSPVKGREETAQVSFAKVLGAHTADSTQYDLLKENAIANRKTPTEAEAILWDLLKGNNIGLHFRRQHIILDYIVDFICLDKGLVIELDGGYHNNPEQKEFDEQRTAHLQRLGYTELRFTNEELLVNPDSVVAKIKEEASKLPSLKGRTEERLGTVYEWFECGLNADYKEQYPSVMATWAGMQYANEHGCARYDMMGAGVPGVPYGVRDFKSEFGGDMVEHGRFLCVCKPLLYKLGVLGVKILKRK